MRIYITIIILFLFNACGGSSNQNIEKDTAENEENTTLSDNRDSNLTASDAKNSSNNEVVETTKTVDIALAPDTEGKVYNELNTTVSDNNITAKDSSNNEAVEITITVNVVLALDTEAPVITLNGDSVITLVQSTVYNELNATVSDNRDINLMATVTGLVDINTIDSYTITYNAKDSSNNEAVEVSRTVNVVLAPDTEVPVIFLNREEIIINDKYFHEQWYLEKNNTFYENNNIDINASIHFGNSYTYSGKGVRIAIIDDGLDITHPDLNNSIISTYDITTKTSIVSHSSISGHHGTAVTGIIGANDNDIGIKGIASGSDLIFLKHKEGMSDSETIELFNKAKEFGADIINCSWGTYNVSESVREVITDLAINGRDGKGTIIVFATGNNGQEMGNDESAIPEVISVGSTDKENLRAWYSNYGEHLDILAPGGFDIGIATLDAMGYNGIGTIVDDYLLANDANSFIGTSASAPIITGVIALMLEKNPKITRIEVEEALKSKSDKIGNIDYIDGFNEYYGYGKINVSRLLD